MLLGAAQRASAQPLSAFDLRWSAPAGCPSGPQVEREIAQTVGGRPLRPEPLQARVDVFPSEAGGWKGEIELTASGQTSRRQVRGDTCGAVARAVAIVVGVAAIAETFEPPPGPAPPRPPSAPPEAPVLPPPAPPPPAPAPAGTAPRPIPLATAPAPRAPAGPRLRVAIGGAAVVDAGSLPAVAPGAELVVGLRLAWWQIEAVGTYLASESQALSGRTGQGASVWMDAIGGRTCAAASWPAIEVGPCLGGAAGWLHASGYGADVRYTPTALVASLTAGARGAVPLARWLSAGAGAELVVPLDRPTFVIDNAVAAGKNGTVFHPSPAAFRGSVALQVHF